MNPSKIKRAKTNKVLLSNYAFSKPYSSNNPHEVCVLVEAAEAVATDFVRFGDERKR